MTKSVIYAHYLCMAGTIRTMQKCPKCLGKYPKELVCPACLTTPTRFYIDIWWSGERLRIFTDPHGFPLDSKARTEQILATIRHQIGSGQFDPKEWVARELKSLQFEVYAQVWLERMEQERISQGWLKQIQRATKTYFIPYFGRTSIRDIRDGHIIDFKRSLPAHLGNKTVSNILRILHRLLAEAKDRKDILVMPKFPKVAKVEPDTKWLTWEQQELVLAHLKEPYLTFFLFCMRHGCRLCEARALTWDCIDLKRSVVTIKASFDLNQYKPHTKEGEVRKLPLNNQVRQALLALPRSITGFVFINRLGKPLSGSSVRLAWSQAANKAGIKISPYQGTRHSFATQKLIQGYSERMVMEATGHSTIQAFRRYGKLVTEALRGMIDSEPSAENVSKPSVGQKPTK